MIEKKYITINNLEKYHPGYKDRKLIWCKTYFTMLNAEPEFEMLCEIDKWRFVCFVMLELQTKRPVLLDEEYLSRKGFDFKKRKLSLTIDMLQTFTQVISESLQNRNVYKEEVYTQYKEEVYTPEKDPCNEFIIKKENEFIHLKDGNFKNKLLIYLKGRKKKASNYAIELILKKLQSFTLIDAINMLEQSIMNGWQGIFELREVKNVREIKQNSRGNNESIKYDGIEEEIKI